MFSNNREDPLQMLEILVDDVNPVCIAIQETKFKKEFKFSLRNYQFLHQHLDLNADEIAHGGVGIFVRNDLIHRQIPTTTKFQTMTIQTRLHRQITICNIYIHPTLQFTRQDLTNLADQLPKPFIITGDFNSHNVLWNDHRTDNRGTEVEHFVLDNDLCILDKNEFTFFRGHTQSHVVIFQNVYTLVASITK